MLHGAPISILFPYTTLFRSYATSGCRAGSEGSNQTASAETAASTTRPDAISLSARFGGESFSSESNGSISGGSRSEEHTSELQSQSKLVCRLLLEKKK